MTLEEIRFHLQDRNIMKVSKETDIFHQTLYRIRAGKTSSAKKRTLRVLTEYFSRTPEAEISMPGDKADQ